MPFSRRDLACNHTSGRDRYDDLRVNSSVNRRRFGITGQRVEREVSPPVMPWFEFRVESLCSSSWALVGQSCSTNF
jgi:hypothetical protein